VADEHHHEGLLKAGEADVRAALAAEPENALALAGVGHVHALMNQFEAAESHLTKALKRAPTLVSVARELASVRRSQGRPGPAAEAIAAALPFAGDPSELLVEQAHALTAAGEGQAALVALRRAIALRPSVALIRREAATLMAQLNDPEGAARELLEACRRTLCTLEERRLDARMMFSVDRSDLAWKVLEAARADHPNDVKLREDARRLSKLVSRMAGPTGTAPPSSPGDADTLTRARALLAARKPAEAVELLSVAVAKRPEAAELHHWLGLATGLNGDMDAAVRHLERASALPGGADPALLNDLGMAQKSVGRLADAQRTFEWITQASPGFAFAWFNLATLLEAQGRRREALGAVEGGLRAAPDDAEAKTQRDALRKALGAAP
jgi:tetratricopeptide (TPR) repeat protein